MSRIASSCLQMHASKAFSCRTDKSTSVCLSPTTSIYRRTHMFLSHSERIISPTDTLCYALLTCASFVSSHDPASPPTHQSFHLHR